MDDKKDLKNVTTTLPTTDVYKFMDDVILKPAVNFVIFYSPDEQNPNSIFNTLNIIKISEQIKSEYPKELNTFVCALDKTNPRDESLIDVMGVDYMPMMMAFRDGQFSRYKSRWFNDKEIRKFYGSPFTKAKKKKVKKEAPVVEQPVAKIPTKTSAKKTPPPSSSGKTGNLKKKTKGSVKVLKVVAKPVAKKPATKPKNRP